MHVLLIARHYPPEISGGARRPSLYLKALREMGHKVTLVTPFDLDDQNSIYVYNRAIQNSLSHSSLGHEKAVKVAQSQWGALKAIARDWVYWPDHNIGWVRNILRNEELRSLSPDMIFTTSPPESIHIAGAKLAKVFNVPWVAELRDTWVQAPHRHILSRSLLRRYVERIIARRTLRKAAGVTAVSEAVLREVRNYVRAGAPEKVITHFSDTVSDAYPFDPSRLNLVHTGGFTLSDRRRGLLPLLKAMEDIAMLRPELSFHIAGPLKPEEYELAKQSRCHVVIHGAVPLATARALQKGADGLVLYTPPDSHALPGKYSEYCMAGRPILYMGGGDWLALVDAPDKLRPLVEGGIHLEKGEVCDIDGSLDYKDASLALIAFFQSILEPKQSR